MARVHALLHEPAKPMPDSVGRLARELAQGVDMSIAIQY
jgi:hypothetical protein